MRLFSYDAPLWRAISLAGDLIILNLLTLLCALPVVTAGASFTALLDATRRLVSGEGKAWTLFFTSFRSNFRQSTTLWAILGPLGAALLASWIFLQIPELLVPKALFAIVYCLGIPFAWGLVARFENRWQQQLKNAWLIALGNLPIALAILVINAAFIALAFAALRYAPQSLPLLALLGVSLPAVATVPLLERAFKPLLAQNS